MKKPPGFPAKEIPDSILDDHNAGMTSREIKAKYKRDWIDLKAKIIELGGTMRPKCWRKDKRELPDTLGQEYRKGATFRMLKDKYKADCSTIHKKLVSLNEPIRPTHAPRTPEIERVHIMKVGDQLTFKGKPTNRINTEWVSAFHGYERDFKKKTVRIKGVESCRVTRIR